MGVSVELWALLLQGHLPPPRMGGTRVTVFAGRGAGASGLPHLPSLMASVCTWTV